MCAPPHERAQPLISEMLYPRAAYESEPDPKYDEQLQNTLHAQPATIAVSVGAFDIFKAAGLHADFAAGHSLGEIAALHAAGALDRETAFKLVCHRGAAMASAASSPKDEAMAAVIGVGACDIVPSGADVWLANLNEPGQAVISGTSAAVASESSKLAARGFRVVPLKVSGAFHTPLMQVAGGAFAAQLKTTTAAFRPTAGTTLYSNVTGEPAYATGGAESVGLLSKHMTSSVQWIKQVHAMHRDGARVFVEFGPRSTLTKLVSQILPAADDLCVVAVNPSKDKSADLQLREAAAQLAVYGVPLANFDPWGVPNPFLLTGKPAPKRPPMKLSAATFVAPRTKKALEATMNDGYKLSGQVVANVGPTDAELKVAQRKVVAAEAEAAAAKMEAAEAKAKLADAELALQTEQAKPKLVAAAQPPAPAARPAGVRPAALEVAAAHPAAPPVAALGSDAAARAALAATDEVSLTYAATEKIAPPGTLALTFIPSRPVLLVDDGTPFTPQLATQLATQLQGVKVVVLSFSAEQPAHLPLPVAAARVEVADRTEKTLEAALVEVIAEHGVPCSFVYMHSEKDKSTTDEHTQLRWALLAAKHLKTHLNTPFKGGRCAFLAVARMGNDGRLGVENAGVGNFPATADPLPAVLRAQRGAVFGLCKALGLEWHRVFCRAIDLADALDMNAGAAAVVTEMLDADLSVREVGYDARGQRYTSRAKELLDVAAIPVLAAPARLALGPALSASLPCPCLSTTTNTPAPRTGRCDGPLRAHCVGRAARHGRRAWHHAAVHRRARRSHRRRYLLPPRPLGARHRASVVSRRRRPGQAS